MPNLQSGNYDVIIAGMSITAEREGVDFTQNPFPSAASAYVTLTADPDLKAGNVSAQVSTNRAG